ncbi:hypothetical protein EGR_09681 [Echinococcus granulosus]|uniref:Uncharacterized protein n=1 Tax=Echinococcus granulosus TaxID=6210 RepID=W6U314_ECHGR|nr:hypothetical protein EGR_09681 [Echinococcus granulosus]EUB55473.1 hypothetical protein EGR_09681 [Echinococcus granulosus]
MSGKSKELKFMFGIKVTALEKHRMGQTPKTLFVNFSINKLVPDTKLLTNKIFSPNFPNFVSIIQLVFIYSAGNKISEIYFYYSETPQVEKEETLFNKQSFLQKNTIYSLVDGRENLTFLDGVRSEIKAKLFLAFNSFVEENKGKGRTQSSLLRQRKLNIRTFDLVNRIAILDGKANAFSEVAMNSNALSHIASTFAFAFRLRNLVIPAFSSAALDHSGFEFETQLEMLNHLLHSAPFCLCSSFEFWPPGYHEFQNLGARNPTKEIHFMAVQLAEVPSFTDEPSLLDVTRAPVRKTCTQETTRTSHLEWEGERVRDTEPFSFLALPPFVPLHVMIVIFRTVTCFNAKQKKRYEAEATRARFDCFHPTTKISSKTTKRHWVFFKKKTKYVKANFRALRFITELPFTGKEKEILTGTTKTPLSCLQSKEKDLIRIFISTLMQLKQQTQLLSSTTCPDVFNFMAKIQISNSADGYFSDKNKSLSVF